MGAARSLGQRMGVIKLDTIRQEVWAMSKNRFSLVMLALLVTMLWLGQTFAQEKQERKGTITGRVTDSSHDVLPGARVELQPKGHTVATDNQGQFTMSDVPPGGYKITVSYVGFAPFETAVRVTAGEVARVEVVLAVRTVTEEMI